MPRSRGIFLSRILRLIGPLSHAERRSPQAWSPQPPLNVLTNDVEKTCTRLQKKNHASELPHPGSLHITSITCAHGPFELLWSAFMSAEHTLHLPSTIISRQSWIHTQHQRHFAPIFSSIHVNTERLLFHPFSSLLRFSKSRRSLISGCRYSEVVLPGVQEVFVIKVRERLRRFNKTVQE